MTQPQPARGRRLLAAVLLGALTWPALPEVQAQQAADETFQSAVFLLRSGVVADRTGRFSRLLNALRHLEDPALVPLYNHLLKSDNRVLRIHGLLGLAECGRPRGLDLTRLAEIKDAQTQAELISAAIDSDLLDNDAAKQLLTWKTLDIEARMVVVSRLMAQGQFNDAALLRQAADDAMKKKDEKDKGNLSLRAVIGLMLLQLDDPMGAKILHEVDQADVSQRDTIRAILLQTAYRFKFNKIAPWAAALATEPGVGEKLGLLALRTAMRFGHPGVDAVWTRQYNSAADAADKIRLALILLNLSPWVDARLFDPVIASEDPLLKAIGEAGRAVASKQDVVAKLARLVEHHYPIADAWVLGHAANEAAKADAVAVLTALIKAYGSGPERYRSQQLEHVIAATQNLYEVDREAAARALAPILADPNTDANLLQGILVGLIRVKDGDPHTLVKPTEPLSDYKAEGLRLLLLVKSPAKMTPQQLAELSVFIRGGGSFSEALRIQAAWAYLKRTNQTDAALAKVLAP